MKRTGNRAVLELELKRRLELVRTTIRDLSATQLGMVNGGEVYTQYTQDTYTKPGPWCPPFYTD